MAARSSKLPVASANPLRPPNNERPTRISKTRGAGYPDILLFFLSGGELRVNHVSALAEATADLGAEQDGQSASTDLLREGRGSELA